MRPALAFFLGAGLCAVQCRASPDMGKGRCCEACAAPLVKYYSIDHVFGHCGECCLNPKRFKLFKFFEPGLTLAGDTTCEKLGYPTYDSTVTHGVWPVSVSLDLFDRKALANASARASSATVTLYRIVNGKCGQATLDEKYVPYAASFAGMAPGRCIEHGYALAGGLEATSLGGITIELFAAEPAREAPLGKAEEMVTLYKLANGECGQATLDKRFESYAVSFAGLKEGLCSAQGYSVAAGSKELKVPVLGEIKVELFTKSAGLEIVL